jgi:hypothetical protein
MRDGIDKRKFLGSLAGMYYTYSLGLTSDDMIVNGGLLADAFDGKAPNGADSHRPATMGGMHYTYSLGSTSDDMIVNGGLLADAFDGKAPNGAPFGYSYADTFSHVFTGASPSVTYSAPIGSSYTFASGSTSDDMIVNGGLLSDALDGYAPSVTYSAPIGSRYTYSFDKKIGPVGGTRDMQGDRRGNSMQWDSYTYPGVTATGVHLSRWDIEDALDGKTPNYAKSAPAGTR